MVQVTTRLQQEAALSMSISPLLPSSMEDEDDGGGASGDGKRVRFGPLAGTFQPTHTVFTPKLSDPAQLRYRKPDDRLASSSSLAPPTSQSSVVQPNYDDFLRRTSVVLYQHIRRCEKRIREQQRNAAGAMSINGGPQVAPTTSALLTASSSSASSVSNSVSVTLRGQSTIEEEEEEQEDDAKEIPSFDAVAQNTRLNGGPESTASPKLLDLPVDELFREEHFVTPQYKYTFIRLPRVHPMTSYVMEKVTSKSHVPTVDEIFRFCKNLFNKAQLSAECAIVCLIYIERLMEQAGVPLLARTWKPIVLCGLLLASKVWQDLSSWNVEISCIYPQYPLHSINRLERLFLHHIQWDLYISASVYAKYYFALRSLTEKKDFRRRYNYTMRVDPPNSKRLEERSAAIRHELYSKSL